MDFSSKALEDKSSMEKISLIIDRVKDGDILVLEGSLSPFGGGGADRDNNEGN